MTKLLLRYNPLSSSKAVFSPVAFMVSPPSYSISLFGFCSHYSARTFLSLVSDSLFTVLSFPSPAATHLFAYLLWASVTKKLSWHPSPHPLLLYLSSLPNKRRNYPKSLTAILSLQQHGRTSPSQAPVLVFLLPSKNLYLGVPQALHGYKEKGCKSEKSKMCSGC